jgi:serine/threonine-protein kinase
MMGLQTPPQPTPADALPASVGPRVSSAPQSLELGSVVDRYRVLKALGEGAMGAVYQVEHVHMKKAFALKVLHASTMSHPEIVARFEREAHAAGQIDHPNVATATDFGKLPNGSYFLVLEYAEGRTLRTELEAGALEPRRALTLLHGVVSGVAAAHAKGIVHRDLKPENIMLVAREGNPDAVKVLDFGIAKVGAPEPEQAKASGVQALTRIGTVMGTPEYMAPEQALGGETDVRSDLYSIGVILFEMITGRVPYTGEPVVILKHHIATPIPEIPPEVAANAGPQVVALVHRLMSKEPEGRVQTATELLALIEEAQRGVDRALEGSARTLLGDASLAARMSSPMLPTVAQPTPLARAATWLAGVAPPAARERLTPRQMVYAAAGVAAFVMLVPVAVLLGIATSGRGETPEQVAAVRAAGFATTEPRVVTPVPLPPPSAAPTSASGATAATAAKATASASASAGGRTAKTTGTSSGPKKGQPQGGQSGGSGLNVPKEVKDFFNKL